MSDKLMSIEEFNDKVRGWTVKTRSQMAQSAPVDSGTLRSSLSYALSKNFGHISKINYKFPRHGVFVHYGVGRGYKRSGGTVVKTSATSGFNRRPDDWFDIHVKNNMPALGDVVQDFYGDLAMTQLLEKIDRFLIEK